MDMEREARRSCTEGFLSLLGGLRKVPARTPEDKAYNEALADAYDYYIVNEPKSLFEFTVNQGGWKRD